MAFWQLTGIGPREVLQQVADALEESFEFEPGSTSLFEHEGKTTFKLDVIYDDAFDDVPDEAALRGFIQDRVPDAPALTYGPLPEEDWVAKSLEGLQPITAGRFVVHGSHDAEKIPAGKIPLLIEAGQAFGTGHHGTTEGCLTALSIIANDERPTRILDLGTGTGILAIGAAKLWRTPIWATDIDRDSVAVAKENAALNGAAPHIRCLTAAGLNHPDIRRAGPFDLIVANILAGPLRRLAPEIAGALAPGGLLVLSGILQDQANRVDATYRALHIHSHLRMAFGEWVTLVGRKDMKTPAATILD